MSRMTAAAIALALVVAVFYPVSAQEAPPAADALGPRQARFLSGLASGKTAEAFAALMKGSRFSEAQIKGLVDKTVDGIKMYGGAHEGRTQGAQRADANLAYGSGIVTCERGPLFFYFVWYRPKADAEWKVHAFWFDDKVKDFRDWTKK